MSLKTLICTSSVSMKRPNTRSSQFENQHQAFVDRHRQVSGGEATRECAANECPSTVEGARRSQRSKTPKSTHGAQGRGSRPNLQCAALISSCDSLLKLARSKQPAEFFEQHRQPLVCSSLEHSAGSVSASGSQRRVDAFEFFELAVVLDMESRFQGVAQPAEAACVLAGDSERSPESMSSSSALRIGTKCSGVGNLITRSASVSLRHRPEFGAGARTGSLRTAMLLPTCRRWSRVTASNSVFYRQSANE